MKRWLMMSEVLYENSKLKVVESMNEYMIVFNPSDVRIVCNGDCLVDRICIKKGDVDER